MTQSNTTIPEPAQHTPSPASTFGKRGLPPKVELDVKHVLLVLSGKGGAGKTTVAVNLAMALSSRGFRTGLLDLDIHGPDVAKMLGVEGRHLESVRKQIEPLHASATLSVISMAFLLPDSTAPVVWRGPMKMTAVRQFLEEVHWGSLDFLVVDLPPGTGDEALSIIQLAPNIRGAIVITTPQEVSVLDASKAVRFIEAMEVPVLGIIENMSGMTCPHCQERIDLFGKGGGLRAAERLNVPFLGEIPLDPEMVKAGDEGRPYILRDAVTPARTSLDQTIDTLLSRMDGINPREGAKRSSRDIET